MIDGMVDKGVSSKEEERKNYHNGRNLNAKSAELISPTT